MYEPVVLNVVNHSIKGKTFFHLFKESNLLKKTSPNHTLRQPYKFLILTIFYNAKNIIKIIRTIKQQQIWTLKFCPPPPWIVKTPLYVSVMTNLKNNIFVSYPLEWAGIRLSIMGKFKFNPIKTKFKSRKMFISSKLSLQKK